MKQKLHSYCGSIQQEIYARRIVYEEGRAQNLRAIEVKCGDLFFHVMVDKCLDISDLSYKGMNMTFLSKPGLTGRNHYDTNGGEAQRSIMGGLFFTCGYENICAPVNVDGKDYPMHGRMRSTPAEHVSADVVFEDGVYKVVISGEIREAELFGENMVLRRKITSVLGENSIVVEDTVENQSFREEPLMLLYHCNAGYPFLHEGTELVLPGKSVKGREAFSEEYVDRWNVMDVPKDNEQEYVFIHEIGSDTDGNSEVMLVSRDIETALSLSFNRKNLPYFMEWKSTASGDYVIGLEPANSAVYGKKYHLERGDLHTIKPFEKESFGIKFTVFGCKKDIDEAQKRIEKMKG